MNDRVVMGVHSRINTGRGKSREAWKSGPSAPRKRFEINAGFSPGGHSRGDGRLFPHPARKPTLITSTKAMILIILSLALAPMAALIARSPFAVAARSPL